MAKAALGLRQKAPRPPVPPPTAPDLGVRTTNQNDEDFRTALAFLDAVFQETSKVADGETLKEKPWSKRRFLAARLGTDYGDWSRIVSLWERAGVIGNRNDRELAVSNKTEGRARLRNLMQDEGFVEIKGVWMRR